MHKQLQEDLSSLEKIMQRVSRQGLDYLKRIDERSTTANREAASQGSLPEKGLGTIETQYKGQAGIRAAFVNFRTMEKDIERVKTCIRRLLTTGTQ
ncbi:MAG: hypothetical protein J7599_18515 [Niabella sp.]|nr:hypothetical protein [Niabella sp.]